MSTLHDLLADLAQDAPPGGPLPDLWQRGRRIARVRRLGTAAVVSLACLALLAVAVLGWNPGRTVSVAPADGEHTPAMPDRLYEPSGWLGSFEGAPGPLAAVFPTRQQHLIGSEPGLVGVSASTGRYGFLDVPDLADMYDQQVALTSDGRRVAYWTAGTTGGDPNTTEGGPVTGLAVLDTTSGHVRSVPISTLHGLSPSNLAWIDGQTLLVEYGQYEGGDQEGEDLRTTARSMPPMTWRVGGELQPVADRAGDGWVQRAGGHGWLAQMDDGHWRWALDNVQTGEVRLMRQPNTPADEPGPAVSPDGGSIALVGIPSGELQIFDSNGPKMSVGADERTFVALYWLDDRRVVATRRTGPDLTDARLEVFDLGTRRWAPVVSGSGVTRGNAHTQRYAFDLLASPTRPADGPPHPLSQRVALGLTLGILLVSGLALRGWRRRVRP